jgi:hypothetical protein
MSLTGILTLEPPISGFSLHIVMYGWNTKSRKILGADTIEKIRGPYHSNHRYAPY